MTKEKILKKTSVYLSKLVLATKQVVDCAISNLLKQTPLATEADAQKIEDVS